MNQNIKFVAMFLVFTSLATMAAGFIPETSAGPATSNLLIKLYLNQAQGENDLANGDIDIEGWPLSANFIWDHANDPSITMDGYAEVGMMEFDLNDQLWPTGPITSPRKGPKNYFFDPNGARDIAALHFRRAIAHLSNKAKYTTTFMGGYGWVMETIMPVPALEGFTDYETLSNGTAQADPYGSAGGYLYAYDPLNALWELWMGGFVIPSGGSARKWFPANSILEVDAPAGSTTISAVITGANATGFNIGDRIQIGEGSTAEDRTIVGITSVRPNYFHNSPGGPAIVFSLTLIITVNLPLAYEHHWRDPLVGILPSPPEDLPNMKLWTPMEHLNLRQAGQDLYNELLAIGIPAAPSPGAPGLDLRSALGTTCKNAVMADYDYNIYIGGWSVSADPDFIFDLLHSTMGQYSYAPNYPGFKNHEFDSYAESVKYTPAGAEVRFLAIQAQWVANKYCPIVWLWCAFPGVKGYRTGWQDVINEAGAGIDNFWTFYLMNWNESLGGSRNGPANTIVYGILGVSVDLHIIMWPDHWPFPPYPQHIVDLKNCKILSCVYSSLLQRNPFSLAEEVGALATSWSTTASYPGWEGKMVCEFTLRTDATFHDGTPVKPADVAYSILAVKAAGQGYAWNYPVVMDVNSVQIQGQVVRVFFGVNSQFALHWSGFMPIINKDLWDSAIGSGTAAGYTGFIPDDVDGTYTAGTYSNAAAIGNYHPWEQDANGNGITDLKEDGSGPWSYVSYTAGQSVALTAYPGYYNTIYRQTSPDTFTSMSISSFVIAAFHGIGNVNYEGGYGDTHGWYHGYFAPDKRIWIQDAALIFDSMPSDSGDPWGPGPGQYNPDADINCDGIVNVIDLAICGMHIGMTMG